MRILLALLAACMLFPAPSFARVVGREGVTYPIKERDLLEVIEERAAAVDAEALQEKLQAEVKKQVETFRLRDAVSELPIALESRQYRIDLTYTVPNDVQDLHGNIIYPKGHKVNPLKVMADQQLSYPFMLMVINGEREAEVAWFADSKFNNPRVKILISDGHPYKLADRLTRPVFQLTQTIKERFRIQATPSIIFWPKNSEYLTVRTIPVPELEQQAAHDDDIQK